MNKLRTHRQQAGACQKAQLPRLRGFGVKGVFPGTSESVCCSTALHTPTGAKSRHCLRDKGAKARAGVHISI